MTERQDPTLENFDITQFEAAPPLPEADLQELEENEALNRKISRRRFGRIVRNTLIATSPVTLGVGGIYLDQKLSERKQSEEVEVSFLDREARYEHPGTAILTLPGFNVYRGYNVAKDITEGTKDFAQVAGIRYGNKEFNIPAILRSAEDFIAEHRIKKLQLYGHSMGGLVALELAGRLKDTMEDVEIENIFLDCSPVGKESIRDLDEKGMQFISLLNRLSIYGGTRTNYVIEAAINFIERDQNIRECFENARNKLSNENCSNRMAVQQLTYMTSCDEADLLEDLPSGTRVTYLRPESSYGDNVINSDIAWHNLEQNSKNPTKMILLPGTGHASPGAHKKLYNGVLHRELTPPRR